MGDDYRRRFDRLTIAVVIPLYNGRDFIEEALGSVLRQSRKPDEIIVVDDGSTDGSDAIAAEFLSNVSSARVIHKANGGQSSARNLGINSTTCDFIALLDQDDVWYEDHLSKLSWPFLNDRYNRIGWTYSNIDAIDQDGHLWFRDALTSLPVSHPKRNVITCISEDMMIFP